MPNVYEIVTEQVIRQLEQGVAPWRKPWRGLNVFMLATQGYESRYWLTFNQANKLGGHVKKGAKSTVVVFWHVGEEKINAKTGKLSQPFLLRYYNVFNLCQTDGIAEKLGLGNASPRVPSLEQCEAIVSGMPNCPAREQSDRAWYRPSTDSVGMPARSLFNSPEEYYSTLSHELTHSTGHTSRVGRE